MTIMYKALTQHTDQVLKDFIRFTYKVKHPKAKIQLSIMGIGFLLLALFLKDELRMRLVLAGVGLLILVFVLTRHLIVFRRLARKDERYQKKTNIEFKFGQAEFIIADDFEDGERKVKYSEITDIYCDKRNLYLLLNGEELQVMPWQDFTGGSTEEIKRFLILKTKRKIKELYIPFSDRLRRIKAGMKEAEVMHNQKIGEKQNKKE